MMRKCVLTVFAWGVSLSLSAQETDTLRHWGGGLSINPGSALVMDGFQRKYQRGKRNFALDFEAVYSALPADSDDYAADFGYPTLGVAVKYSLNHGVTMHRSPDPAWGQAQEVDYDTRMGNAIALYGTFARPLLRNRWWEVDYTLNFGVGYSHSKYSPHGRIDNELIGSRWLIFFGAGVHATWRMADDWGVRAGLEYWHLSNGALNRPNKGANFLGPSLGLVYRPYYDAVGGQQHVTAARPFWKYWMARVTAGVGAKTLNEDWQLTQFNTSPVDPDYRTDRFKTYIAYSLQADVLYRYARRWASGIGADIFYGTYSDRVEEIDKAQGASVRHSPWSLGLAAKHEVYYHQLRLAMSLGVYLYRHMGVNAKEVETPYYERIGVHYAIPRSPLTIGINVKAHRTKADLTELVVAYNFDFNGHPSK